MDYTVMNPSVLGAGGDLVTTTRDLNRFFGALLGGRLLPGDLLAEMKTAGVADLDDAVEAFVDKAVCG